MLRQFIAILLLACFGILVPVSASQVRVCLLEGDSAGVLIGQDAGEKCCEECSRGSEVPEPCCVDVEDLPDSTSPQSSYELPPVVLTDLPEMLRPAPLHQEVQPRAIPRLEPIRGPTSPTAYRAVLGIWTL